jgi:8-amino-7-oxononanoate synthase
MRDFTSSLYLGLRHASAMLMPWNTLTLGKPAALREPPGATHVAAEIARLQGCEAGVLLPSTLHLFWDLFGVLAAERLSILCDASLYPIARWGVERTRLTATPVQEFPHHDVSAAMAAACQGRRRGRKLVIVTDGFCPMCGSVAPLAEYADIARRFGGYLVVDDTQSLGILGAAPETPRAYGTGGGGSLQWHGISGPHILVGSSLAKGFGAPLAVLAGSRRLIERFRREADTPIHCSPPSLAAIHAARHALEVNRQNGEWLRSRLKRRAVLVRHHMARAGLRPCSDLPFPVQTFDAPEGIKLEILHRRLRAHGVLTVLVRACVALKTRLALIVTACHSIADVDYLGDAALAATNRAGCRVSARRVA